ncbi:MAG: preprotein translocase subunit SecG [Candidatus Woesebacteria bacterium]|jgi:protein translocase SecG subunit|nr:MAG: preprotein translocase subunit SecG [Candidatus Woesebacteria bacterium]
MKDFLLITQIVTALVVIFLVTIQTKGTGLGRSFGQSGSISFKRRGIEKLIFKSTFLFSGLFLLASILRILI